MATHSSILAWRIPWTDGLGGYSPWVRKSWTKLSDFHFHFILTYICFFLFLLLFLFFSFVPITLKVPIAFILGMNALIDTMK